jgi:hypothetical protein
LSEKRARFKPLRPTGGPITYRNDFAICIDVLYPHRIRVGEATLSKNPDEFVIGILHFLVRRRAVQYAGPWGRY